MKKILPLLLFMILVLSSCTDKKYQTYMANVPQYMSYEDLRSSFTVAQDVEIENPGKIYLMGETMYINEFRKGIHVVDLGDPSNPQQRAFISIPGNVDMAIRDDVLYADSYVDLLLIDVSDPENPFEIGRLEDIFEFVIPPYDNYYPLAEIDQDKGVVTGFVVEEYTQEIHYQPYPWPIYGGWALADASRISMVPSSQGSTVGVAGSMTRFLTKGNYLYTLESSYNMVCFDISDLAQPVITSEKYLGGNVETLFIAGNYMYVGSSSGMHILSLDNPAQPVQLSTYWHITSCDPVVVRGDLAYVTLRAGNQCGGDQNRLDVVDISSKYDPSLLVSYPMTEPYGLGIYGETLYVCEGMHGLKVYDVSDATQITQNKLSEFSDIHAYDVIPAEGLLFAIGDSGLHIYDTDDLSDIRHIGSISVGPGID